MLCTAMVIVVISVMGGWLRMFKESFHDITGDIVVARRSLTGFGHYKEMIEQIEALPEVSGAAPTLHTFGLVNIDNVIRDGVQVVGLDLKKMSYITGFRTGLYRQYGQIEEFAKDKEVSLEDKGCFWKS
jgi:ABC-type lipoprotein release transport system permease subunit